MALLQAENQCQWLAGEHGDDDKFLTLIPFYIVARAIHKTDLPANRLGPAMEALLDHKCGKGRLYPGKYSSQLTDTGADSMWRIPREVITMYVFQTILLCSQCSFGLKMSAHHPPLVPATELHAGNLHQALMYRLPKDEAELVASICRLFPSHVQSGIVDAIVASSIKQLTACLESGHFMAPAACEPGTFNGPALMDSALELAAAMGLNKTDVPTREQIASLSEIIGCLVSDLTAHQRSLASQMQEACADNPLTDYQKITLCAFKCLKRYQEIWMPKVDTIARQHRQKPPSIGVMRAVAWNVALSIATSSGTPQSICGLRL